MERKEREDAERKKNEFFLDMEANMRRNIARGYLSADVYSEAKAAPAAADVTRMGSADERMGLDFFLGTEEPDRRATPDPLSMMDDSSPGPVIPHRIVRTISTVDDLVLEEMKRTESFSPSTRARRRIDGSLLVWNSVRMEVRLVCE